MKIKRIPITKINTAPYNPRKDLQPGDKEYEKIKRSIQEFDLVEPLIWNEHNGVLIGGHQRLKVIKERGDKEVEVSVVNIEDINKEKALNVALNKAQGDWDFEKLSGIFKDLQLAGYDMTLTGFEDFEIAPLIEAEWNPPAIGEMPEVVNMVMFRATAEQAEIINKAIGEVRVGANGEVSDGRALELICADFLA